MLLEKPFCSCGLTLGFTLPLSNIPLLIYPGQPGVSGSGICVGTKLCLCFCVLVTIPTATAKRGRMYSSKVLCASVHHSRESMVNCLVSCYQSMFHRLYTSQWITKQKSGQKPTAGCTIQTPNHQDCCVTRLFLGINTHVYSPEIGNP